MGLGLGLANVVPNRWVGVAAARIALIAIAVALVANAAETRIATADEGGPRHSCADHDVQQLHGTHDGDGDGIGCENLPAPDARAFPIAYVGLAILVVVTLILVAAFWWRHRQDRASRPLRPATRRQLDYLRDLIAQHPGRARDIGISARSIKGISRTRASELIDAMQPDRREWRASILLVSEGSERQR